MTRNITFDRGLSRQLSDFKIGNGPSGSPAIHLKEVLDLAAFFRVLIHRNLVIARHRDASENFISQVVYDRVSLFEKCLVLRPGDHVNGHEAPTGARPLIVEELLAFKPRPYGIRPYGTAVQGRIELLPHLTKCQRDALSCRINHLIYVEDELMPELFGAK